MSPERSRQQETVERQEERVTGKRGRKIGTAR